MWQQAGGSRQTGGRDIALSASVPEISAAHPQPQLFSWKSLFPSPLIVERAQANKSSLSQPYQTPLTLLTPGFRTAQLSRARDWLKQSAEFGTRNSGFPHSKHFSCLPFLLCSCPLLQLVQRTIAWPCSLRVPQAVSVIWRKLVTGGFWRNSSEGILTNFRVEFCGWDSQNSLDISPQASHKLEDKNTIPPKAKHHNISYLTPCTHEKCLSKLLK